MVVGFLIPNQGHYNLVWPHDKFYYQIKYVSPEGWQTLSPMLVLDFTQKNVDGIVQSKY
jgi:hypothetical protein